ncbi:hypothetical protein ACFL35_05580 [Candidatus Riflebacteria bacterium]
MKKIFITFIFLSLSTFPIFGSKSAFSFIPKDAFGFVSIDAQLMVYDFFQFYNLPDSEAPAIDRLYNKIFKTMGKPLPEPHASRGYFAYFADLLKALQNRKYGNFVKKCHLFLLPGILKNPKSRKNVLLIMEGEFNLDRLGKVSRLHNPNNHVGNLEYQGFQIMQVQNPGNPPTWAVQMSDGLLIGTRKVLTRLLSKEAGEPFFERKMFNNRGIRDWGSREPYVMFYLRGPGRKSPFRWAIGGLNKDIMDIRVQVRKAAVAEKYVKDMKFSRKFTLRMLGSMKANRKYAGSTITRQGFTESLAFIKNFRITYKRMGMVFVQAQNPGMNGLSRILGGFADFFLAGWAKAQGK